MRLSWYLSASIVILGLLAGCQNPAGDKPAPSAAAPTWKVVGTEGFGYTAGSVLHPTLAFGPTGTPYVAFIDITVDRTIVQRFTGSGWVTVGTEDANENVDSPPKLAVDRQGVAYRAFKPNSAKHVLVQRLDGSDWVAAATGPEMGLAGSDEPILGFDLQGRLLVAFLEQGNVDSTLNGRLTVVTLGADGKWALLGPRSFSPGSMSQLNMAVEPRSGTPYVAATSVTSPNPVEVRRYDFLKNSWVTVGAAPGVGLSGQPVLAFDRWRVPYLGFRDITLGIAHPRVMKLVANTWTDVGAPGLDQGAQLDVDQLSLSIDPSDRPLVVYNTWKSGPPGALQFNGLEWVAVGGATIRPGKVDSLSMGFSPQGVPHVAFRDLAKANRVTVLRYE